MPIKKRYAVVGLGARARVFTDAIAGSHQDSAELVAFCDPSETRMGWHNRRLTEMWQHPEVPTYVPADFEMMLSEQRVDSVIVTTVDALHHEYIIRAMHAGCDAITEKPMTTDAPKARAILHAIESTGRKLTVTFNLRYHPLFSRVKELVLDGTIGRPTAVTLNWSLDTRHGADYFRRWHRDKSQSGGLLIHKSTHHFDIVNWILGATPQRVYAQGGLKFYGQEAAGERGEKYDYERYTGSEAKDDPFHMPLDGSDYLRQLYMEAESDSGYVRDKNVFGSGVTIEDTISLCATYDTGVLLNYSLIAYSPREGFDLTITGTRGRIHVQSRRPAHVLDGSPQDTDLAYEAAPETNEGGESLTVYPMFRQPYHVPIDVAAEGHGGSDPLMLAQIFGATPGPDPLNRQASYLDGLSAILLGIAANQSMETDLPVETGSLVKL